jgi:aminopeptidase YwaD
MRICLLFIALLFSTFSASAQKKYAERIINVLTQPDFHGRGYIGNGDKKAADFIAKELKSWKAKPFGKSYFQEFTLDVNTFPDSMRVTINGKNLVPGQDFIVGTTSGSAQKKFTKFVRIDGESFNSIEIRKKIKEEGFFDAHAVIIEPAKETEVDFKKYRQALIREFSTYTTVLVVNSGKFTWGVGREAAKHAIVEVTPEFAENITSLDLNVRNEFVKNYKTQNVIGYIQGTKKSAAKKYYCITAHYDHLGRMGTDTYFPGANDNASGTAMVLNTLKYYSEHPPEFSIAFMLFGAEEAGILGSKYYTENPLFPLNKIKFVVNMDIMGTGDEGVTVVNATEYPKQFDLLVDINNNNDYLMRVKKRGEAANSDHYWFHEMGIPSFFIYTMGGIKAYHDIYDRPETLPLTEFEDIAVMLRKFIESL